MCISLNFITLSLPQAVYNKVMPLYFPRTPEEEAYSAKALPADLGNEFGEPVIAERQIRIATNPTAAGEGQRSCKHYCYSRVVDQAAVVSFTPLGIPERINEVLHQIS